MTALAAPRTYAALAALQAGDAVACAIPLPQIEKAFDDVGLAPELRPLIPYVKVASAIGLLSVFRFPWLARLTTFMLTGMVSVPIARGPIVRWWRRWHGRCIGCGYDLRGSRGHRCSECGLRFR